ncbi:hypothetical protein G9A89_006098 [Geosiphon pyriformis]|nr:hypothetical protein G9A89_006098 [Geosiphon pyriformis]
MEKLLQWGISNSTSTGTETPRSDSNEKQRETPKIDSGIIDVILGKSDAVKMKEIVQLISDPQETLENKEIAFDNLEMIVQQIDNAIDLENMKLWPQIISFLSLPVASLRVHALWVCGTAVQNNIRAQKAFAQAGGLRATIDLLKNEQEEVEVRSKALYAISGAIKHYQEGLDLFDQGEGYEALLKLLQTSDDIPMLRKTTFLLETLLKQDSKSVASRMEEKGLLKQMIKILNKYGDQDDDLTDKIFSTLLALLRSSISFDDDEIEELRLLLPDLKQKYQDIALSPEQWNHLENCLALSHAD